MSYDHEAFTVSDCLLIQQFKRLFWVLKRLVSKQFFGVNTPYALVLFRQPRVTVTSYLLQSYLGLMIDISLVCINPILQIGLIHKRSFDLPQHSGVYKSMF